MISPIVVHTRPTGEPAQPLRAHEILIAVHTELASMIMGKPMDEVSRALFKRSLREALLVQFQLRGTAGREAEIAADRAETELDVVEDEHGFTIMTEPDWAKHVDRALRNRDCPRCGSLLVTSRPHDGEECDLVVLRNVLES